MKKKELLKEIIELNGEIAELKVRVFQLECERTVQPSSIPPYIVTIEPSTTPWKYPWTPITTCTTEIDIVGCSTSIDQ